MRLHRFFVKETLKDKEKISIEEKDLTHQWKNVFRLKPGNEVILLDNSGFEFFAVVTSLKKDEAQLEIINIEKNTSSPLIKLHLFPSLIKKERFEWILEKGTELGVSSFTPVLAERSQNKNLNPERGEKIIKEAAEQSGKGTLPALHSPEELKDLIFKKQKGPSRAGPGRAGLKLLALDASGESFKLDALSSDSELGVLVGPEGGWSEKELEMFKENKIPVFSLGPQILRAETASAAAASLILLDSGNGRP